MAFSKFKVLAAAAALTVATSAVRVTPFQNGNFESNNGVSNGSATTATGWTTSNGAVNFTTAEGSTNGSYSATYNGGGQTGNAVLSQTFDTTANQLYTVTFDYGNYNNNETQNQSIQVNVKDGSSPASGTDTITAGSATVNNGANTGVTLTQSGSVVTIVDGTGNGALTTPAPNAEFSSFSFTFTALSSSSTLAFTDLTGGGGSSTDGMLDNVKVATPEPASVCLLALGSLGLLARRRRA